MQSALQPLLPPFDDSSKQVTFRMNQRRHWRGRAWKGERCDDRMDRAAAVAEHKFDNDNWARFGGVDRKFSSTVGEHLVRSGLHIVKASNGAVGGAGGGDGGVGALGFAKAAEVASGRIYGRRWVAAPFCKSVTTTGGCDR